MNGVSGKETAFTGFDWSGGVGGRVPATLHEMVSRDVEEIFLKNQEREQALRNLLKTRPSESRDVSLVLCCTIDTTVW